MWIIHKDRQWLQIGLTFQATKTALVIGFKSIFENLESKFSRC